MVSILGGFTFFLGSVDISSHPQERADKVDKAQIRAIQRVEAGEDAPKVLEFVDTTLDEMAFAIEPAVVLPLDLGALMRRNDGFTPTPLDRGDTRRCRIAPTPDAALKGDPVDQGARLGAVMTLARGQAYSQRIA